MIEPKTNLQAKCLCGSGRKYKNCCWPVEKRTYAIARRSVTEAHQALIVYLSKYHEDLRDRVIAKYFDRFENSYGKDAVTQFLDNHEQVIAMNLIDSAISDLRLDNGSSLVDEFLLASEIDLHPSASEYLENLRDAPCSLYEITKVVRGSHFEAYDLLSRKNIIISDVSSTETLEKWQVFFLRTVECGGEHLLSGLCLGIPRIHLDYVMNRLRQEKKRLAKSYTWARFLKKHWGIPAELWTEIHGRPMRFEDIQNTDGEPVLPSTITITIVPGSKKKALEALLEIPEVESDQETSFVWSESRPGARIDPVVIAAGDFNSDVEFKVFVNSMERCERVEKKLKEVLSGIIVSFAKETEEMDFSRNTEKNSSTSSTTAAPEIPADMIQELYEKLYSNWSTEPIPALGDITPKNAVKTAEGRRKVINLLKSYEITPDGHKVDFSFLWNEVGLKRPD